VRALLEPEGRLVEVLPVRPLVPAEGLLLLDGLLLMVGLLVLVRPVEVPLAVGRFVMLPATLPLLWGRPDMLPLPPPPTCAPLFVPLWLIEPLVPLLPCLTLAT
jgi:hypothetical protein